MQLLIRSLTTLAICTMLAAPHLASAQTTSPIPPCDHDAGQGRDAHRHARVPGRRPRRVETAEKVLRRPGLHPRAERLQQQLPRRLRATRSVKGFQSIGAEDNTVVIFSDLMDANSLFLTANADTVYYLAVVDLTKGPMVIEQPPKGLGTINDMWFSLGHRHRLPRSRSR